MRRVSRLMLSSFCALAFASCDQETGEISRDTKPFDGIAKTASISAIGTEPFWAIDIEPASGAYEARYSSPEDLNGTKIPVVRFAGNNGISFSGELRGETVHIALTPGLCSDAMSDRTYPYTATVAIGARTLLGCGYTSDEPLTDDDRP